MSDEAHTAGRRGAVEVQITALIEAQSHLNDVIRRLEIALAENAALRAALFGVGLLHEDEAELDDWCILSQVEGRTPKDLPMCWCSDPWLLKEHEPECLAASAALNQKAPAVEGGTT